MVSRQYYKAVKSTTFWRCSHAYCVIYVRSMWLLLEVLAHLNWHEMRTFWHLNQALQTNWESQTFSLCVQQKQLECVSSPQGNVLPQGSYFCVLRQARCPCLWDLAESLRKDKKESLEPPWKLCWFIIKLNSMCFVFLQAVIFHWESKLVSGFPFLFYFPPFFLLESFL